MTLHALLARNARKFPDRPWLQFEGQELTYAQADALTDRIAAALVAAGVKPGDRVAQLFTNCPEFLLCVFACFKLGAVAVPLNTRFQVAELVYALNHSGARVLVGQAELCAPLMAARAQIPAVEHVFIGSAPRADAIPSFAQVKPEQLAVLLYTSGTTAKPKGVMHSHATLLRQNRNYIDNCGEEVFARTLVFLPLCHIAGFGVMFLPTTELGGTATLMARFDPAAALRLIAANRITYCGGLPVYINALINCPEAGTADFGSMRLFLGGGDTVPLEMQKRFHALFGCHVEELCGMTEIIYTMQPHRARQRRPGSIGKPIGDIVIRLEDEAGNEVPAGAAGEIVVYSRGVTLGYWNDPESTAAALKGGGMHSGDLARRDADGFIWFVGRSKDIIIRGGSNIAPAEVEEVLYAHPAVYEAGVIGTSCPELGQRVRAYVALKPGAQATDVDLIGWAGTKLAAYKVPESVVFVEALPKGVTGKVHRKTLRDQAQAGRAALS